MYTESPSNSESVVALSLDLRERIVSAYERQEGSQQALAIRFSVGRETVGRLVRQYRSTGSLAPKSGPRGKTATLAGDNLPKLVALVEEDNGRTLDELVELLETRHNIETSTSAVSRILLKHRISRKKNVSSHRRRN
jgi:transposase